MAETGIQWCHYSFNPWIGCTKDNKDCMNCYAITNQAVKMFGVKWGPSGDRAGTSLQNWKNPRKWNDLCLECGECKKLHKESCTYEQCECGFLVSDMLKIRPRVFCASLADVFEDWTGPIVNHKGERLILAEGVVHTKKSLGVSRLTPRWGRWLTMQDLRGMLFKLIDETPNLDWLLLTKRPQNIIKMWCCKNDTDGDGNCHQCFKLDSPCLRRDNVWLGTSCGHQEAANVKIPELLKSRHLSSMLFLSCEPLLEYIDFTKVPTFNRVTGKKPIDLVIAGGESGKKARMCDVDWIRRIGQQCKNAGVPFFVKQLGSAPVDRAADDVANSYPPETWWPDEVSERYKAQSFGRIIPLNDKKGGDLNEWPEDLRVREMPIS